MHHHVVVRRGNMTSVRDVVFVSLFCTLCNSNPLRFDEFVLMIFLQNMKSSIFEFPSKNIHLHGAAPAGTVQVACCGDFARPSGSLI